jgi:hypothetical protein
MLSSLGPGPSDFSSSGFAPRATSPLRLSPGLDPLRLQLSGRKINERLALGPCCTVITLGDILPK